MIPMPARIAKLPTYRGRPVPVTVLMLPNGTVDFRVTDTDAWFRVVQNRLCGICGEKLDGVACFLGGPISAQSKAFADPPMHEECARYSAQVCPYLAGQKTYADMDQIRDKHTGKAALTEIPVLNTTDPLPQVWMVKTTHIEVHILPDQRPVLVAQEPVEIECLR